MDRRGHPGMISAVRRHRASIVVVCTVIVATAIGVLPAGAARKVKIRLDQIQTIGTHNSYHLPPRSGLPPLEVTNIAQAPLDVQLEDQNVRSFELDAYDGPNFPVFHSLITDEQTTCLTMRECLEVIDTWSRKHRKAVPITILLEPKALPMSPNLGVQGAIDSGAAERGYTNWDVASLGRLDALVRRVFGKRLLTPDDVRGKYKTLREAIIDRGWPSLKTSRGKIVVALNTGDP